jgi:hypothetical protein
MVSGSARKVLLTKPPSVATAQTATKTTKKVIPSATRAPGETGVRGFKTEVAQVYFRKRVSANLLMSGKALMMPASSRISAAFLLKVACSPAKNF